MQVSRLKAVGVDGLFAMGAPPEWIISGVIPENGVVMISADPYSSKTFFALEACLAVATGTPFMGHFPVRKGRTLYIGEDSPAWDVAAQVRKLLAGRDMLSKSPEGMLYSVKQKASLDDDIGLERILDAVQQYEPDLVVLDSLKKLHFKNENDAQEMERVMARIDRIRGAGPSVLIIHHESKPGQDGRRAALHRARGSSAISADLDGLLSIAYNRMLDRFVVEVGKSRALAIDGWQYDLLWDLESAKFVVISEVNPNEDAIVAALKLGKNRTLDLVAAVAEVNPKLKADSQRKTTSRALAALRGRGLIRKVRFGEYALVDNSPE
jgi:KaiC/GvpD/RAD55 family RecA-like ATPase